MNYNSYMGWIAYSIISAFLFAGLFLTQRILAIDSKYPRALTVLFNLAAIFFSVTYFFLSGLHRNLNLPSDPKVYILVLVAILFYGLFERGRYITAKHIEASTLSIISNVSVVISTVSAFFIYRESLTGLNIAGMILIMASLLLASYTKTRKVSLSNIGLGLLVYSILGIAMSLDKYGARNLGSGLYSQFVWVFPILVIIFPKVKFSEIRYELRAASWKILVPAFLNFAAYLLSLKAFELGDATKIIPLINTSTLITVVAGVIFLGEKDGVVKKIFAGILALIGSYFLIGAV